MAQRRNQSCQRTSWEMHLKQISHLTGGRDKPCPEQLSCYKSNTHGQCLNSTRRMQAWGCFCGEGNRMTFEASPAALPTVLNPLRVNRKGDARAKELNMAVNCLKTQWLVGTRCLFSYPLYLRYVIYFLSQVPNILQWTYFKRLSENQMKSNIPVKV